MNNATRSEPLKILVTGGSLGLGAALARTFVERGHTVFICARGAANLERATTAIPGLRAIRADVTDPADRQRLFDEIGKQVGTLDMLVNNAGMVEPHDYTDGFTLGCDRAGAEIQLNFAAPIDLTRLFLAQRLRNEVNKPGFIVNVSTPGGLIPLECIPLYSATKAGLHMFTLALRRQLASTSTKVVEVLPPMMGTDFVKKVNVPHMGDNGPEMIREVAGKIVDSIFAGEETILPHPQSVQLYEAVPRLDPQFVEAISSAVRRHPDWNRP
jgi:uncharacterized oxidoreductase